MQVKNLSPQEMVTGVHLWITRHEEFCVFSGLIMCGETIVTDDGRAGPFNTAATDGWNKYYHPEFLQKLSIEERRYVVLHELAHQAFHHMDTDRHVGIDMKDPREMMRANMAKDYFINNTLNSMDKEGKIKMPACCAADPKYLNWDWPRIYRDLKKNGVEGDSMDMHLPCSGKGLSKEEIAKRKQEIDTALRQGKLLAERRKAQGEGSNRSSLDLDDILYPKINWKEQLCEFVVTHVAGNDESTWRKPNRRYLASDVYLPSMISEAVRKLVVVFDTSGSCFRSEEQVAFVSEFSNLMELVKPEKIVVLYVDSQVVGHQEFDDGQFAVADMDVQGGGGTNLEVAYDWIERNGHADTQAVIVFTDGYTSFSAAPKWPVLWVMTTDVVAPYGQNVKLDLE